MKFNITYDSQIFSWQKYGGISRIYKELISEFLKDPSLNISITGKYHINEYLHELNLGKSRGLKYCPRMSIFPGKLNQIFNREHSLSNKVLNTNIFS